MKKKKLLQNMWQSRVLAVMELFLIQAGPHPLLIAFRNLHRGVT